jgi:hypothetical protein
MSQRRCVGDRGIAVGTELSDRMITRRRKLMRLCAWWFGQYGLRPDYLFRALYESPHVLRDYIRFKRDSAYPVVFAMPCFHDRRKHSGSSRGDYFHQDLYVARKIFKRNPDRHIDVGSRVDGFVAHVASFREIEVIDIRPNRSIPGIAFRQLDVMRSQWDYVEVCDSISCLHALEHFGLGRYGDPLDTDGHMKGLANIIRMLKPQGILYLSVPIGRDEVIFNSHRVLSVETVLELAREMRLIEMAWVDEEGDVHEYLRQGNGLTNEIANSHLSGLGIFTFQKQKVSP